MNKRNFLKSAGILSAAAVLPTRAMAQRDVAAPQGASCVLIPSETPGPFPLDLSTNEYFFRRDVREDRIGVPLNLRMRVIGEGNCLPMPNVRVNIWHCDRDGQYSGYDNSMNPGQLGRTYLRGYQIADAFGDVLFTTIFPGWYPGRVCHIHFQVFVNSAYSAVSQLAFDESAKLSLYSSNSLLYPRGVDPKTVDSDNVFSDGYALQVATLTANGNGGYDSYLEVTVRGTGTTSVGHLEKENAKHFTLAQNFPNPFTDTTAIPLNLRTASFVVLEVYDMQGKHVFTVHRGALSEGSYSFPVQGFGRGIASASFVYQLTITNDAGTFTDVKVMTASK